MTAARRAGALVAAIALLPGLARAQVPTITLDEAIELALQVQPTVVQARGALRSAHASNREVVGSWLPRLSGSGSWARNSTTTRIDPTTQAPVTSPPYSYSAGWSASIEIFDGFRRFAQGRAASAEIASADASLVNQQFQVTLQTKQAFFAAISAEYLVEISDNQIQRAEQQLNIAREKLAAGSATRSDTLRSSVELGNARLLRLTAEAQRENTRAALGRLVGLDGPVAPAADEALFDVGPLDTAELRAELLQTAPAVVEAEAAERAAAAQITVSRAQYFPTLNGSFSQNWSGTDLDRLGNSWAARLSLNWNLFNGFTREGSITRAKITQESAAARADDARRQASAQLTQYLAALTAAQAQIEIAEASLVAAQEDLRVVQERYRLGAATIVEVLTSQVTLDQAEIDVPAARYNFLVALAELEALLGREL